MSENNKKDKDRVSESCRSCCYDVVDACGCFVGTLCCENNSSGKCILTHSC